MATNRVYQIELGCTHKAWWRYNVQLQCGAYNEAGDQIGFSAESRIVAEVGANLKEAPEGFDGKKKIALTSSPCHRARVLIYILPHSLPVENRLDEVPPFEVKLRIRIDGKELRTEKHMVNPWSGTSIELTLE